MKITAFKTINFVLLQTEFRSSESLLSQVATYIPTFTECHSCGLKSDHRKYIADYGTVYTARPRLLTSRK